MVRLPLTHVVLIWLAGALCVLATTGINPLNAHEVFAAEPAREMLNGQSLILQPFAGQYRTKKPPGQSWLIAASMGVLRRQNEWTARLPSAISGILLAWVVAVMANRPGRPWRGLIAGIMTLTCVSIQQWIRLAEADMALALSVALANAAVLYVLTHNTQRRKTLAFVFWGAIVAGFLLKGPVVLGFTFLPALVSWALLRFRQKDRAAARALAAVAFYWPAVLSGIILILAWPVAALSIYPAAWAQWKYELVDRARGTLGHKGEQRHDPLLTYVWAIPFGLMPWFIFLPSAAVWGWRNKVLRRPASLFVACWGGVGFVLLSAVAFKTLHYAIPIVPAFILAAAVGFDALLMRWVKRQRINRRILWRRALLVGWLGTAVVVWTVYQAVISPAKQRKPEIVLFAKRVNVLVPPDQTIYLYNMIEEQTAWYLDRPLHQMTDLPPKQSYVMCKAGDLSALNAVGKTMVLAEAEPYAGRETAEEQRMLVRFD